MSGLEDLLSQIPTSEIAGKLGVDEGEVDKAVQLLVPVLVGGLQENAQDPDHASNIESAADNHAASGLLDGGVSLDHVNEADGQQAIAKIFGGNDVTQVANALAGGGGATATYSSNCCRSWRPSCSPTSASNSARRVSRPSRRLPPVARSTTCWAASWAEVAGGNKSLGTVLGNVLGAKAGDILGGLFGNRSTRSPSGAPRQAVFVARVVVLLVLTRDHGAQITPLTRLKTIPKAWDPARSKARSIALGGCQLFHRRSDQWQAPRTRSCCPRPTSTAACTWATRSTTP